MMMLTGASYLCHFLEVLVALLQRSGSVERLPHPCVFAEEGLAMVFYPVQNLCKDHTLISETTM